MSNASPHSVEFTHVPFKSGWSMPTPMPTSLSNRDAIPTLANLAKRFSIAHSHHVHLSGHNYRPILTVL